MSSESIYPLVSVLMTAYNREKYIGEAIESVLASSYSNFELVIVDDCSKDRTVEIIREFEQKDSRIKFHINEQNLGDYPNRNKAAHFATGEYIMHVDSDDKIYPDAISRSIEAIQKFPEAAFGMCHLTEGIEPFYLTADKAICNHFFQKAFLVLGPGGTIIKRQYFNSINCFPEKYGPANDMYFNLKAVSHSGVLMMPFKVIYYRNHEGQEKNNHFAYLYHNYNYLKDALKELPLPLTEKQKRWLSKKNKRRFLVNIIRYYLKSGNMTKTKEAIDRTNFRFIDALQGVFH
jgi:glycosyltransferase involved in cell wall biosynthesis